MSQDDTQEFVIIFGDFDPEDEYDEGDALRLKLDILERVIESIREHREEERAEVRKADALRLIVALVKEADEDRVRMERIRERLNEVLD